jgi:hypothetical protein
LQVSCSLCSDTYVMMLYQWVSLFTITFFLLLTIGTCMYVCMYKGWATKTSPCTTTLPLALENYLKASSSSIDMAFLQSLCLCHNFYCWSINLHYVNMGLWQKCCKSRISCSKKIGFVIYAWDIFLPRGNISWECSILYGNMNFMSSMIYVMVVG